jgi:hypothetical protein
MRVDREDGGGGEGDAASDKAYLDAGGHWQLS